MKIGTRVHLVGEPTELGTVKRVRGVGASVIWDKDGSEPFHWMSTLRPVEADTDRHPDMTHLA